jgi:hypothetical protein
MRPMAADDVDLEAQREQFHRELMRKSMRIAELELELEETTRRFQESMSWRLMKPVRVSYQLAKGLRPGRS